MILSHKAAMNEIALVERGAKMVGKSYFQALRARSKRDPRGPFLHPTPVIKKALFKAVKLHKGQLRKGESAPVHFVSHLLSVAEILARHTRDEAVLVAGLLHDALEDGEPKYAPDALKKDFGARVCRIVGELAERDADGTVKPKKAKPRAASWRDRRKERYLKHLEYASQAALMVCCADKTHNFSSLLRAYNEQGEALWRQFKTPREDILWFFGEVARILKKRLKKPIAKELQESLRRMRSRVPAAS